MEDTESTPENTTPENAPEDVVETAPQTSPPDPNEVAEPPEDYNPDYGPPTDESGVKGRRFSSDTPSMDEIIRRKKPVRKHVDIPLNPDVTEKLAEIDEQIERLERELNRERTRAQSRLGKSLAEGSGIIEIDKKIERLEAEYDKLWDESQDAIQRFWFQDIGKKKYDDLVSDHPPTPEQKKEWEENGGEGKLAYNTETFPPALLAKSAINPTMTVKQAEKIFDEWGNWEVIRLFNTAQLACSGASSVPKSRRSQNGTEETPTSA